MQSLSLTQPDGAVFCRVITNGDDEIERLPNKNANMLWAAAHSLNAYFLEYSHRIWIDLGGWLCPGTKGFPVCTEAGIHQRFCQL